MHDRVIDGGIPRGLAATMAAGVVTGLTAGILGFLPMVSPSSPPLGMVDNGLGLFFTALIIPSLFAVWLLPACGVAQWIMTRKRRRDSVTLLGVAILLSTVSCAALFLLPAKVGGGALADAWSNVGLKAAECFAFVFAWLLVFRQLTPREGAADSPLLETPPQLPAPPRTGWKAFLILPIAGALVWTSVLGVIGSAIAMFSEGDGYNHRSSVQAPDGKTQAHLVDYSWGGALGGGEEQVYLLAASESWTPKHRGLLLWQAEHFDVQRVDWASPRQLVVRVLSDSTLSPKTYIHSYPREGFVAQTLVVRKSQD